VLQERIQALLLLTVKILYVSQYFPPEMGAPAARVSELSQHWVRDGHEVTVLTGFPNHPTGVVPPEYRHKLRRLVMRESAAGVKIMRTWLWPLPNRKAHERMLNYTSFCLSSAITGLFLSRPDVVIGTSPQLLVALSAWWLARCKRVPFIFEVRDLWPESLAAVGVGKESSLLHRILAKIAGFLYKRADRIVVVSSAFKDHLIRNWQLAEDKISIVENGVETDLFRSQVSGDVMRRNLCANEKFVVCYAGTMGMAHGLETLLDAAAELQQSAPDVLFLLVGEGAERQRVAALAESRGLKNVVLLGQQPRERMPALISASDACLVLLKKADLFKTVIPTKMLEFMACSRPVILGVEGQARKIVEEAGAGICIQPENAAELATAIRSLNADRALCQSLGRHGREYILRRFSRKATAEDYIRVLECTVLGETLTEKAAATAA
jgi:putative colanic acid biosynthesis glycosyltransferase WcaI